MCSVLCRDGEPIEEADDEEKYSFNYDGSELIIKKVDKSDEAEYICIAENKAGEQDATIHLKVFGKYAFTVPPFPIQLDIRSSLVRAGSNLLLPVNS